MSNAKWDQKLVQSREAADRSWQYWTADEDRAVINAGHGRGVDERLARDLGRSITAVQIRRHHLRRKGLLRRPNHCTPT